MAFNNYNNNEKKKNTEREVFGDIKFYNPESEIDPGMLSTSFWNGLIKISISPVDKSTMNNSTQRYDHENGGAIFLRPVESLMLSKEILNFIKGEGCINSGVLNTKKDALIFICSGEEYGVSSPCLSIKKIDEDGNVLSSYVYKFRTDNSTIRNFNEETKDFEKFYYSNLELIIFQQTLEDFYRSMNGAYAYGVMHYGRFDNSRTQTKLNSIAEKLGVQFKGDGNGFSGNRNSVFDKSPERETHFENIDPEDFNLD